MGIVLDQIGKLIAGYLQKELPGYEPFTPSDPDYLRNDIQPGDVLLVEGNNRISGIIKYLTQSTWSHAALYVGPIDGAAEPDGEHHVLIEANVGEGVTSAPLSRYFSYHTRMCRPVGLSFEDRHTVCRYAINRIGFGYDTKNILDLMRYLIPMPIPQRWRRRMIALGSGDPTKMICSALIAQHFLLDTPQCRPDRRYLGDDVDAVAILVDHFREPADLALDPVETFLTGCLDVLAHAPYIPPRGIYFKGRVGWITYSTRIQARTLMPAIIPGMPSRPRAIPFAA